MSLAYGGTGGLLPVLVLGLGVSIGVHLAVPASLLPQAPPPAPLRPDAGLQGAIMFDLSDVIAAPSHTGEDQQAAKAAVDAPTVTESPEVVEAAQAADTPVLNQTPYEVPDDTLKFRITSPEPVEDTPELATETAQTFDEEQVDQPSQLGAHAADAAQASVSGIDTVASAERTTAQSEGLSAEQTRAITEWQKAVVLRIAKAKAYPPAARSRGIEGEVQVKFTLDRYGAIVARSVQVSSGAAVLDNAALQVFDDLGKLPTPPGHLQGDSFTLIIPLNYRIRKG